MVNALNNKNLKKLLLLQPGRETTSLITGQQKVKY
jgi:hypothetical protein